MGVCKKCGEEWCEYDATRQEYHCNECGVYQERDLEMDWED